ncbi:hypothetical protein Tco_1568452 [Tanacetum coccineum]
MVAYCLGFDEFLSWFLVVGYRDVTTTDKNDIMWLMTSMGSSPCLNTGTTDKVIHIMETDKVKLVVEIESFGMSSDEFDKETGSSDGL